VAQPKSASKPTIDSRLVGAWWNEIEGDGSGKCETWEFKSDGTGAVANYCTGTLSFKFTTENGKIKFQNAQFCDEEGCQDSKMNDRDFSFSGDGKTLNLGKMKLTGGVMGRCC